MLEVRPFSQQDKRFREMLDRGKADIEQLTLAAGAISDLSHDPENKLLEYVRKHDWQAPSIESLRVGEEEISEARNAVPEQFLTALSLARVNIRKFHEYQRRRGYMHDDGEGVSLFRRSLPLSRIGILAGTSYSALLMCAVPAQVAGVGEIAVAASPDYEGKLSPHFLAACKVLDIGEVYKMSAAHAAAALALGIGPVARVVKLVGPGDRGSAAAKQLLSHRVGVDLTLGLSELAVIADATANARFIASDMLAQAEHDEGPDSIALFTTDRLLAEAVRIELDRIAEHLPRADDIAECLNRSGAIYVCQSLVEAVNAVNALAPAKVSLMTADNEEVLSDLETVGTVYSGPWSTETSVDYFAGINQLSPIHGGARFSSGLGVDDFTRESSVIEYSAQRLLKTGRHMMLLAEAEGRFAHSEATRERLEVLRIS